MNSDYTTNKKPQNERNKDTNNWIWGFFYYNRKDHRLFTPKKSKKLGWTINFANPNSAFLAILLIAVILIVGEFTL